VGHEVVVVGAGMVGLSCAWFLQEAGADVIVVDRRDVCAGSSWGNAGWIAPALTVPLPDPSVLRYGLRAVLDPASPVYVPPAVDPGLWRFLLRFARNCTPSRWAAGMARFRELNAGAVDAFEQLTKAGVGETISAPLIAGFSSPAAARPLMDELRLVVGAGQPAAVDILTGAQARSEQPLLADSVAMAVRITGTRYIYPARFGAQLAEAVRSRGGRIVEGTGVRRVARSGQRVIAKLDDGRQLHGTAAVVAAGAWLGDLVRDHGVDVEVRAGRGYSFTVATETPPTGPLYLPEARVACTPTHDGRLRVAGMMEFRGADDPLDSRRTAAMATAAGRMLLGVDWSDRQDEWVGSRPVTANGLPLIGPTRTPGVFVAGGHGMWGITLGPVTGRMIADHVLDHAPAGAGAA
jgi:D-amino-acid dehydrogenase